MTRRGIRVKKIGIIFLAMASALAADARDLFYSVRYQDITLATQRVTIVESDDLTTVASSFEAKLPVFVALHDYAEKSSVTIRGDGAVTEIHAERDDGMAFTKINAEMEPDGLLRVFREDRSGVTTNHIAREDYDATSLSLYLGDPAALLPSNRAARILFVDEGRVEPVTTQFISESETFERQNFFVRHVVWREGIYESHSWHPARRQFAPSRYIRHTRAGDFIFDRIDF